MRTFREDSDLAIIFRNLDLIDSCTSALQITKLFRHPQLGRLLVINGELQHAECWQALYHEPLVHLPISFVPELRSVLILGGGSLFAAAEVFRYCTVRSCTLVDHDRSVLELMAKHYDHARRVIEDPRFEFIEQDAIEYLKNADHRFDLVVNDCFDSGAIRISTGFSVYQLMSNRLASGGVCTDMVYRHVFDSPRTVFARKELDKLRPYALSLVFVPEYPGVLHLLTIWGSERISQAASSPANLVQQDWSQGVSRPELEFYNPEFLQFHLYVPPNVRRIWANSPDEGSPEAEVL